MSVSSSLKDNSGRGEMCGGSFCGFTVVKFPFIDPSTGKQKEPLPYTGAWIRLDGADTDFMHFLKETDEKKLKVGMRVEAVYKEKLEGDIKDIEYFRVVEE